MGSRAGKLVEGRRRWDFSDVGAGLAMVAICRRALSV